MEFGLWSSRLNTHTHTHTLSAVDQHYCTDRGHPWPPWGGNYHTSAHSQVQNKDYFHLLQQQQPSNGFQPTHIHTNKPWSTPNSIFISSGPWVYRSTIICLEIQNSCRSEASTQDTLLILPYNTNPNHTQGTSNALNVAQILQAGLFRPISLSTTWI